MPPSPGHPGLAVARVGRTHPAPNSAHPSRPGPSSARISRTEPDVSTPIQRPRANAFAPKMDTHGRAPQAPTVSASPANNTWHAPPRTPSNTGRVHRSIGTTRPGDAPKVIPRTAATITRQQRCRSGEERAHASSGGAPAHAASCGAQRRGGHGRESIGHTAPAQHASGLFACGRNRMGARGRIAAPGPVCLPVTDRLRTPRETGPQHGCLQHASGSYTGWYMP